MDVRGLARRWLCIVLSASMVIGLLPTQASAEALDDSEAVAVEQAFGDGDGELDSNDEGVDPTAESDGSSTADGLPVDSPQLGGDPSGTVTDDVEDPQGAVSDGAGDVEDGAADDPDATADAQDVMADADSGSDQGRVPEEPDPSGDTIVENREGSVEGTSEEPGDSTVPDGDGADGELAAPIAETPDSGLEEGSQNAQPYELTAQSTTHTRSEAVAYARSLVGQWINYDQVSGADCVDIAEIYYVYLGQPMPSGYGYDYASGNKPQTWSRQSSPQPGDVATWAAYKGVARQWGHVAVVVEVSGSTITVVEQNTSKDVPCYYEEYPIGDPSSYLRPDWPDIADASVSVSNATYTGSAVKPSPTVKIGGATLRSGVDYTVSYKNNVNAGTATVTVTGKGDYSGSKSTTFKISRANLSKATISKIAAQKCTGYDRKPAVTVKVGGRTLKKGTDYTVSYQNNKRAGTATVTVTGKGNYVGSRKAAFKVINVSGSWRRSGPRWWYRWSDGTYPRSAFVVISGKTYRFDKSGWMLTGWQKVGTKWYHFASSGEMARSKWVGSYYVGKSGAMLTSCLTPDGYWVGKDGKWDGKGGIKDAYKAVLKQAQKGGVKYGGHELGDTYTMFDVDGDGKPELIVSTADISWGGGNLVFEYRGGKARYLGWCWNSSGGLYGAGKGKLYKLSGRQGGYHVCRVTKSVTTNGSLKETGKKDFVAKSVDEWNDAYNRCHAYCDSLGAKYLTYVSVTNYSLLNKSL